jgi:YVTN family beta-propeller protein
MATLRVDFTFSGTTPANGFRLRYRARGSSGPFTVHPTAFTTSPALVFGVTAQDYEGFIDSDCGAGIFSDASPFKTNSFDCPNVINFPLSTGDQYIQVDSPINFDYVPNNNQTLDFSCKDTVTGQVIGTISAAVDPQGNILAPLLVKFSNLINGRGYEISCFHKCSQLIVTEGIEANSGAQTEWVEDTYTCEQDSVLTLDQDFTGFSSPAVVMWDDATGRLYVGDYDDPAGNVYWINPNLFGSFADIHRVTALADVYYTVQADQQYRRLYFIGQNSGGLKVFNIADHSVTTVPYGVDGSAFNRVMLKVFPTTIYVHDRGQGTITIIDRITLAVLSTINISSIPSGGTYFDSFHLFQVGAEIWVCSEFRQDGNIAVYNQSLTSLITTIALPGIATESSTRYRQSQYQDLVNGKLYVSDGGSSKLFVIDGATRTIVYNTVFTNRMGKTHGIFGFNDDPITNDLFLSFAAYNSPSDTTQQFRVYRINRTTYLMEMMYPNQAFSSLAHEIGTNHIWGTFGGQVQWSGIPGYNSDGKISKYIR